MNCRKVTCRRALLLHLSILLFLFWFKHSFLFSVCCFVLFFCFVLFVVVMLLEVFKSILPAFMGRGVVGRRSFRSSVASDRSTCSWFIVQSAEPGKHARAGSPIFSLASLRRLHVRFSPCQFPSQTKEENLQLSGFNRTDLRFTRLATLLYPLNKWMLASAPCVLRVVSHVLYLCLCLSLSLSLSPPSPPDQ